MEENDEILNLLRKLTEGNTGGELKLDDRASEDWDTEDEETDFSDCKDEDDGDYQGSPSDTCHCQGTMCGCASCEIFNGENVCENCDD